MLVVFYIKNSDEAAVIKIEMSGNGQRNVYNSRGSCSLDNQSCVGYIRARVQHHIKLHKTR